MSIILVYGFWGTASHWANTLLELRKLGLGDKVTDVDLPLTSLEANAARVDQAISSATAPVLLVGHSYGGFVITQAGTNPKVQGLVYIAAFIPDVGESIATVVEKYPLPSNHHGTVDDFGNLFLAREHYHADLCADLDEDPAFVYAVTQKPTSLALMGEGVSATAWSGVGKDHLFAAVAPHDKMISPDAQRWMAERVGAHVVEIGSSHAIPQAHPKEVALLIKQAAEAVGV